MSILSKVLDSEGDASLAIPEASSSLSPAADVSSFCIECEDQPASLVCLGCEGEIYCSVCHASLHRKASRSRHETKEFGTAAMNTSTEEMRDTPLDEDEVLTGKEGDYVLQDLPKVKGSVITSSHL
jgi:hypothetical protein